MEVCLSRTAHKSSIITVRCGSHSGTRYARWDVLGSPSVDSTVAGQLEPFLVPVLVASVGILRGECHDRFRQEQPQQTV